MPKPGGWTIGGGGGGKSRGRGIGRRLVNAASKEDMTQERVLKPLASATNKENTVPPVVKTGKRTETQLQPTNTNNNARPVTAETKKVAATSFQDNSNNNKSNDELALMALTETKKVGETQPFPVVDSNEALPSTLQGELPVAATQGILKRHSETTTEEPATALIYGPAKKKYHKKEPLTPEQSSQIRKGQLMSFARWWRGTTEISGSPTLDDTIARTPMAFVFNEAAGPNYVVGAIWCLKDTTVETSELPYAWMEIDVSKGMLVREGGSSPLDKDQGGFLDSLKVTLLSTMNCDDIPVVASMAGWKSSIATNGDGEPQAPVFLAHVPDWMYAHCGP